uniref:Uncharacterized protein n=1 Tax=Trichobilharzia regenti TaxID=157069 RepID=A0AA85K9Q5_TRIRE|nr:unnamed protein product [Trichobilharzia regenti]
MSSPSDDLLIIIDPVYQNLKNFQKDYDYDLVGNAITLRGSFLRNPIGYLHSFIERHIIELIFISLICFAIFFSGILLLHALKKCVKYIKLAKLLLKELSSAKKRLKKLRRDNMPINFDIFAKAIFTALISYYDLFEGRATNITIPEDLIEYEIIRFVLEAAWKNSISSRQLRNVDLNSTSVDDLPIEGLKADEVKNVFAALFDVNEDVEEYVKKMENKEYDDAGKGSQDSSGESVDNEELIAGDNEFVADEMVNTFDDTSADMNKNNAEINVLCCEDKKCLKHTQDLLTTTVASSTSTTIIQSKDQYYYWNTDSNWFSSLYCPVSSDCSDIDELVE